MQWRGPERTPPLRRGRRWRRWAAGWRVGCDDVAGPSAQIRLRCPQGVGLLTRPAPPARSIRLRRLSVHPPRTVRRRSCAARDRELVRPARGRGRRSAQGAARAISTLRSQWGGSHTCLRPPSTTCPEESRTCHPPPEHRAARRRRRTSAMAACDDRHRIQDRRFIDGRPPPGNPPVGSRARVAERLNVSTATVHRLIEVWDLGHLHSGVEPGMGLFDRGRGGLDLGDASLGLNW